MATQPFKSETKSYAAGGKSEFFDFIPARGPNGGLVVIDAFTLVMTGTITVATALWDGRDVPRLAKLISVEKKDNRKRWNLNGARSRIMSIALEGIDRYKEHADVAVGAGQTVLYEMTIPMHKRFAKRGRDFALQAMLFKKFVVEWDSLVAAATGTTVLSAAAINAYVLADWHEEMSVEVKVDDEVSFNEFSTTTECKMLPPGAIHDLYIHSDGAGGGASQANFTDIRIDELGLPVLAKSPDLINMYQRRRFVAPNLASANGGELRSDPVRQGKLVPVLVSDEKTSNFEGKVVASLNLRTTNTVTLEAALYRAVLPKSQEDVNALIGDLGLNPDGFRLKTEGKTKRDMGKGWTKRQVMTLPWSAPLNTRQ